MTNLALILLLALPVAVQEPDQEGPTKKEAQAAVAALAKSQKEKEPGKRIAGLNAAAEVVHPDVIEAIAGSLSDREATVRQRAVEVLGRIDHEAALDELHDFAKRERKTLPKDPEFYVVVLKSIAYHGNESSIPTLTDKLFNSPTTAVTRTRILALGQIRSEESVEAIFGLMTKTARSKVQNRMAEFRLALIVLLGVDHGTNQDRWMAWWNDNKKSFEVSKKRPKLARKDENIWNGFWGVERRYERNQRRGQRGGDDPETDRKRRGGG